MYVCTHELTDSVSESCAGSAWLCLTHFVLKLDVQAIMSFDGHLGMTFVCGMVSLMNTLDRVGLCIPLLGDQGSEG